MSKTQREIFWEGEGDAWFRRNRQTVEQRDIYQDQLVAILRAINCRPKRVLEIGCGLGQHLFALRTAFCCECWGVEPSQQAVEYCQSKGLDVVRGTADKLSVTGQFDLVYFGASLMYMDRPDLFRIASEADRVLCDPGYLAVLDFQPSWPRRVESEHFQGLWIYSMDYTKMWAWNPAYVEVWRETVRPDSEDRSGAVLLRKSSSNAYPEVDKLYQSETRL